ncbi:MAG TPA: DUF4149 domain-containing protein [Aquabacterium sp.]|uniref:DUF4149 domain-containing protein n=1 Tax=Aquabacterium sp. TaxID=1872578 RepID=UPI002E3792C1|nr:DUF4149 domain-containing protein [Aquabacterium sp.]HEX5372832.1 DUF4149 domain-containing protein [Aquabacterium sp.]
MSRLVRIQAWLAGLWGGMVVGVGAIAAPSLFAVFERQMAGQGAGRIFSVEAKVSLALAIVLFLSERRRVRDLAEQQGRREVMTGNLMLILAALFLTVFGQFGLHPMIEAAKAGQPTPLSFGALHGISAAMFWLKGLMVLVLAWRLTATTAPTTP